MQRPDFGIGKLFVIRWTEPRKAYVRHLAGRGFSAAEIAVDIGLEASQGPRISMACRKFGIRLHGRGGRKPQRMPPITVQIAETNIPVLDVLSTKYGLPKVDVARRLTAAMFEQGEAFLDNLLDLSRSDD